MPDPTPSLFGLRTKYFGLVGALRGIRSVREAAEGVAVDRLPASHQRTLGSGPDAAQALPSDPDRPVKPGGSHKPGKE